MSYPKTLPIIRPISDLRTRLNEVEAQAKELGEPIIMTKNGSSSLVVMDSDAYEEMALRQRAIRMLREAEIEAKYLSGTFSHTQMKSHIDEMLEVSGTDRA